MPADGLGWYSADVSDGDRFTSQHVALGLRWAGVGITLVSSPNEAARWERGAGSFVRWLFFVNYRVVNFSPLARALPSAVPHLPM